VRPLGYPRVSGLSEKRQKGLRAFWLDGLFASLAGGFADPYYTLYMLSLHASNAQIGLVNTLSQLAGATLAIPGAAVADNTGRYKRLSVFTGLISRLMWLVMLIAPWLLVDEGAVWLVLIAWVAIAGVGALGNAAWTALSADLVPVRLRGGYFASRNIVMQLVRLLAIPLAGQLVDVIGEPVGYQVNLGLAFAISMISLYYYNHLPEHPPAHKTDRLSTREVLRRVAQMPTFKRFIACHTVLYLGVMIGGPFIAVYMVQEAHFDTGTIGLVTTVNVLASLLGMRVMGRLHDRFGITWTMRFGLGVPLITVLWLWVKHPWQAYLVNSYAALTWAGYNLGAFNLLLASTPNEHRPRFIAIHTTIVSVVAAIGPIIGGALLDSVGFAPVFSLSTLVRASGLVLFFLLVREPDSPPDVEDDEGEEAAEAA
jgi:MFS family permease